MIRPPRVGRSPAAVAAADSAYSSTYAESMTGGHISRSEGKHPRCTIRDLARDEVHSVMHCLDRRSRLALALCSHRLLQDASCESAWKHSDVLSVNLARRPERLADSRLLRFLRVRAHAAAPLNADEPRAVDALLTLPRITEIDVFHLEYEQWKRVMTHPTALAELTYLRIGYECFALPLAFTAMLARSAPKLQRLHLPYPLLLFDKYNNTPQTGLLHSLDFGILPHLTELDLVEFAFRLEPGDKQPPFADSSCMPALLQCANLRVLILHSAEFFPGQFGSLFAASPLSGSLRVLTLSPFILAAALSVDELRHGFASLVRLEELRFSTNSRHCHGWTADGSDEQRFLSAVPSAPSLVQLSLMVWQDEVDTARVCEFIEGALRAAAPRLHVSLYLAEQKKQSDASKLVAEFPQRFKLCDAKDWQD